MNQKRPSLGFEDALDAIDLARFVPKPKADRRAVAHAATAAEAEAAGFRSREPREPVQATAEPDGQEREVLKPSQQRRRRTGRTAQFNLKARPETITAYCAIADRMGWGLGETLERAVELLQQTYGRPD
jgi:hypothetical protein